MIIVISTKYRRAHYEFLYQFVLQNWVETVAQVDLEGLVTPHDDDYDNFN